MVGVVSLIPTEGIFFLANYETLDVNFVKKKMPEMSDMCYLGKTRLSSQSTK